MERDTDVLLQEERIFYPDENVIQRALIKNWEEEIQKGKDIEKYWAEKRTIRMV